jgi:hypothetical protein
MASARPSSAAAGKRARAKMIPIGYGGRMRLVVTRAPD